MKRRTPIIGLLILILAGGLFYLLKPTENKQSRLGNWWDKLAQQEQPLPVVQTEAQMPVSPSVSEPVAPMAEENLTYDQRVNKGDYYFEKGFYTFAGNEYTKATELEPRRIEPHLKLVDTYLNLLNYDQAMESVQTLLNLEPENTEAQFLKALIQIKQSDFSGAQIALTELNASPPLNAEVSYYQALLESLFGHHEQARDLFEQAKNESLNPELTAKIDLFNRAYQEFDLAQLAEGAYLEQLLARAYNEAKEYQMTVYSMKELLKERSELRDAWILYGFAYLNLNQYAWAKTAFERAYQLDSTWTPTQFFLGITNQELGNRQEAIKFFNFALANQFEPELVAQQYLADLHFEAGNYKQAVKAYERVIELNNRDLDAYTRPVWIYLDFLNQPQNALALAEIAITLFPEEAMAHNLLGWSQLGMQDYTEAEKSLSRALQLDANLAAAHYNLGKLYQAQRNYTQALTSYQQAYQMDQNGSVGNLAAQAYNDLLLIQASEE